MKEESLNKVKDFKANPIQLKLPLGNDVHLDVRRRNIISSPKFGGSCDIDSKPYLKELGIEIVEKHQPIQFTSNFGERVHRWAPYIQIDSLPSETEKQIKAKNLILLAFSSILIDCSNLKRTPCLGYWKNKKVLDSAPWMLMKEKIRDIYNDLTIIQQKFKKNISIKSEVILANAMECRHQNNFDLMITSPPYMNGLDYVMNYKIEMGWLGFTKGHKEAKTIKDEMVVCDNVSKGLIRNFAKSNSRYTNDWLDDIANKIQRNIIRRGNYRRVDMPFIVAKY